MMPRMRQIWIPRIGGPDVLELREAPDPEPRAGEVRVRVAAAGVNFADVMARMGLYPDAPKLPTVVGYEVAGTVDAVGPGVTAVRPGQRVLSLTRFGGYSDVVCVPEVQVAALPDRLSLEKAAGIPVVYLTAWIMLVRLGNLQPGETVLVHTAAGGVGLAALQIAAWRGARVIGTASAAKHERLRKMGVAHAIDYRTQDFETEVGKLTEGRGVDMVIDPVGGASFRKSYRVLSPLGRLFMFGVSSFAPGEKRSLLAAVRGFLAMPAFRPVPLMNENRGVFGVNMGHLWERAPELRKMLLEILALVEQGTLDPLVDRAFPFAQAGEAHAYIQGHKNFGKVVLTP
jgi:NADPH:quinone reductase-like Zn-dependent oxidoreductase